MCLGCLGPFRVGWVSCETNSQALVEENNEEKMTSQHSGSLKVSFHLEGCSKIINFPFGLVSGSFSLSVYVSILEKAYVSITDSLKRQNPTVFPGELGKI